jgi:hypothetical protein
VGAALAAYGARRWQVELTAPLLTAAILQADQEPEPALEPEAAAEPEAAPEPEAGQGPEATREPAGED